MPEPHSKPLARIFDTPLFWRGWRSLPFTPLAVWCYFTWQAARRQPRRSQLAQAGISLASMLALLGSEWLHNLAHAAAARRIGKPMDALEILAGMPVCIYTLENHRSTAPRQHILRALGGPAFNLLLMLAARLLRRFTSPHTASCEVLDVTVEMNTFLCTASLLPLPGIDGGPLLKWSLVEAGRTPTQADALVRQTDLALSPALGALALAHLRRRRWWPAGLMAFFGGVALAVGLGWMKGETRET
jgi:hypothetical protein